MKITTTPQGGETTESKKGGHDVRCACGNLVARWVAGRVELKCRRCKRRVYLTPSTDAEEGSSV